MFYLSDADIKRLNFAWSEIISEIRYATALYNDLDYCQPIKPYIRFSRVPSARIIAMPAYLGGRIEMAGIKWISSFPSNLDRGLKRASSLTILNDTATGFPVCILSSSLLSAVRTAGISAMVIDRFLAIPGKKIGQIGMIGLGPIGETHLAAIDDLFCNTFNKLVLYDADPDKIFSVPAGLQDKVCRARSWQDCYTDSDIVITCTTSSKGYIDLPPKAGSLHLNVSLRDYAVESFCAMDRIIVDNWEEVARENTDIHRMVSSLNLKKEDTISFGEMLSDAFPGFDNHESIIVNPMGLAVYDIAIANLFYQLALDKGSIGTYLD